MLVISWHKLNKMEYLYILKDALVWVITIFWLYQIIISSCSLIKLKDKPYKVNKKHKFMAIIPAHNEETVIGNLIDSLKNQNYDKDLYDIYVIADNCTDNTAKIAKEKGAIVYKRFDEEHKTKGYALNWFLKQKIEENADYDAFFVFDADNIADKNFIVNMNKKLCEGEEVVQGYRDIKNPTDNWITAGYALFYWTMHRFYHLARYNVGLSSLLNGTGFMVKFDIIKPQGWDTKTLTEDIEFSLKRIIAGKKIGWSTDAIVYDEQPTEFKQSWSQRSRWTVGHIQCVTLYTTELLKSIKKHKTLLTLDGLLYILGSIPMFIISILVLVANFVMYAVSGITEAELFASIMKYVVITLLLPIVTAIIAMWLDKKPIRPMLKGIIAYPIFMGTWLVINFKCLFKKQLNWEKINHVRDIKITEVNEEEKINIL